jgi:hypothetical protein
MVTGSRIDQSPILIPPRSLPTRYGMRARFGCSIDITSTRQVKSMRMEFEASESDEEAEVVTLQSVGGGSDNDDDNQGSRRMQQTPDRVRKRRSVVAMIPREQDGRFKKRMQEVPAGDGLPADSPAHAMSAGASPAAAQATELDRQHVPETSEGARRLQRMGTVMHSGESQDSEECCEKKPSEEHVPEKP